MAKIEKLMAKGVSYLKRNGVKKTCVRVIRKLVLSQPVDYEKWLKEHTPSEEILNLQRKENTGSKPVVAVRILETDPEQYEKTLRTIQEQTYGFLAVSDKNENSDFCLLIRNGALLREDAVYEMVKAAAEQPKVQVFYTDDDIYLDDHYKEPFFKPEFDSCLYLQWDYLGDVLFLRREFADQIPNLTAFDQVIDRMKQEEAIARIPQILVHTSGAYRKKRKLVERALSDEPKVSVIIPNMDHIQDLKLCVESLVEKGGYSNYEILIVENNSKEEETFSGYRELEERYSCLKVLSWKEAFDYAAINNYAAAQAEGEYLLFLNNDTKVKEEGILRELVKWGSLNGCAAVGARLLYADHTIQHGGVVLGYGGIAGHAFEGMTEEAYEDTIYAHIVRRMTAVTAACMLVRKSAFWEAQGFSSELKVAYNDIDLCMKLQRCGYMVLYDPFAQMYHYESQTRGFEMTSEKAKRVQEEAACFCRNWKEELEAGDRFYNPNLTLEKPDFSINRK